MLTFCRDTTKENGMVLFGIYTDFIFNIFNYLIMDLFFCNSKSLVNYEIRKYLRVIYIFIFTILSILQDVPFAIVIGPALGLVYGILLIKDSIYKKIVLILKYYVVSIGSLNFIYFIHTFLTRDIPMQLNNDIYNEYKTLTCIAIVFILLSMYINSKKISSHQPNSRYKHRFNLIIILSIILLSICSMLLGSTILQQEEVLPLIFSLLIIITVLCLSAYRKVVLILEENALTRIQYEQNALQQDYYAHIEENINTLSLLRHDFNNHLIVIDNYASAGKIEELHNYVVRLNQELLVTHIIHTPSDLLSSLLNAKCEVCKQHNVTFRFKQDFSVIAIEDYHLVTILSNIIDNAITASGKVNEGYIDLSLIQVDSYLDINCINNHCEHFLKKGDILMSTKTQNQNIHGLGITSVQKSVNTLDGKLKIQYSKDTFHISVLVPNYI